MAAALAVAAGPAAAHAFLKSASPAVGSTVHQSPGQVVIDFTEGIEPAFCTITVQDSAGNRFDAGDPTGGEARLSVALKPLPPGTYTVTWHATSVDTHKTEGHFSFVLAP